MQHPAEEPRPGPTRMPCLARVTDEVPDDEEVVREAHVGDDAELVFQSGQHFVAEVLAVALVRAANDEVAQ